MATLWQRITKQQPTRAVATIEDGEYKANPNYLALPTNSFGDRPQPMTMPRNYKAYAQEGYRQEATLYKCISYITRNGGAIPPILYTDQTRKRTIDSHPLLDRLNQPNPEQTGVAFREACLGFLLISGNSYQYAIHQRSKPPDELWALRPDYVQIVPSRARGVEGFYYKPADKVYDAADVGHMKYWCPDDDIYGLSPMEVASILCDQQTAARKWNLALLQNWARLPGAWVVPSPLGKNERDRLEQKLKEKMAGYKNAGTPPVLDGGLTWQSMGVPPAQMDWISGMQFNSANISNLFGIPPVIVGDTSAMTFDNMKQAEIFSYTEGIFPDLDKLYALWNMWLVPMYPDLRDSGAYLYYDKQSVEVIQEMIQDQKDAQSKRATRMWLAGECTLNESRSMQGLPRVSYGNVYRIQNTLVKATDMDAYAEQTLAAPLSPPMPQAEAGPPVLPPDSNNQGASSRPPTGTPLNEPTVGREPAPTPASRTEKGAAPDVVDVWLEDQFSPTGHRQEYRMFLEQYALPSGGS